MSSARFLLEFEATGDQEVVNAIKEVGTAGKETAADLDALKNIEDPFSSLSEGADSAVAPIQEVGSAATETVSPLQDMGSATEELGGIFGEAGTSTADFTANMDAVGGAADATVGGLTDANTAVGDFGTSATTAGETTGSMGKSVTTAAGAVSALGGTIGSAVGSLFRYQDIQLKLQKAQAASARATETHRKAEAGLDAILKTATGNAAGIATARQRLADAQERVNDLMNEGVTSGAEYEAAQAELQAAQAALNQEFAKGGGDVAKLTTAMEKSESSAAKMVIATNNLEKATRTANMGILDMVFGFAGLAGSIVQTTTQMKSFATVLKALPLAAIGTGLAAAGASVAVFMGAVIALNKAPYDQIIGQLDKIGKKVGEVFPPVADSLTKLGDQMGSSLDFLAGYSRGLVKQLTGVSLQADVTKKSFSELVQLFLKDGTTGYTQINRAIAGYVDAARAQGMSDKEIIELAKKHNDENKKLATSTGELASATNSVIDPTKGLNSMLTTTGSTLSSVGSTIVKTASGWAELHGTLTDLGNGYSEINGQIIKNSDILNKTGLSTDKAAESTKKLQANWQDVTATSEEMHNSISQLNTTLSENIDKNYEQAHAILTLVDSEQNHTEAISAVNLAYAQSVDKVADLTSVLSDSGATQEAVATQVNNTTAALLEESIKLEAASQSADNLTQQQLRLDNAFKSGVVSIKEWANGLAEAEQAQAGQSAALAEMGARWTDIPPFVERNIETLKLFGVAAKQGGEAAKEAAGMAADAWRDATSEMGSEIENLAGILMEGGKEMKESTKEWFTGIEQNIGRELTAAEQTALKGIGQMMASTEQAINDWQLGQLMGESVAASSAELATAFDGLAASAGGGMKAVFTKAAEIARSGKPELVSAMNEVMSEVGKTSPQALLAELNAILPPGLKDSATKAGEGVKGALDPSAAAAGQSAALTLSQEFAAAGTHIAAVMKGIEANMKIAVPKIPIDVDITPAGKTLESLVNTITSIKQTTKIPVDVDVTPAGKTLSSLVATMSSIRQSSVPVFNINVTPALAALNKIRSALGGVKSGQAGINLNPAPALASIKKVINAMAGIKQGKIPQIQLNINPAVAAANKIRSIVNALPNIKRTITYTYRVVGSRPSPPNLNRTITYRYRTVGSRPAQTGMHENLSEDTMIAAHAGERVDITPNTINTNEERVALVPGGSRGRGAEYVIPVTLMLDNKVLVRTVSRGLMEDVGGVS